MLRSNNKATTCPYAGYIGICKHCEESFFEKDMQLDSKEKWVCDDCSSYYCIKCLSGDTEIENRDGNYICSDCYSSECSDAYDYVRSIYDDSY